MLQFTIIFAVDVKSHMAYRLCHLSILTPATDKMEDGIKRLPFVSFRREE